MQLIGRNLSPFVRRTAVILKLLDLPYEQRGLSTADDADEIAKINPVVRVPSLVLESGECLIDSNAIIDHLMEVGDPDHGLLPANGAERRAVLRLAAIGHGVMEKAVASSYERGRRPRNWFTTNGSKWLTARSRAAWGRWKKPRPAVTICTATI